MEGLGGSDSEGGSATDTTGQADVAGGRPYADVPDTVTGKTI